MSTASLQPPTDVDPERLEKLIQLFHLRWTVPLLAALCENPAFGRVAVLSARLGVAAPTVRRTLTALAGREWIAPNPGHGHPLRPEVLIAPRAEVHARWFPRFARAARRRPELEDVVYRKWSMPTLAVLAGGALRFSELRRSLPQVTDRALTLALRDLVDAGLLERRVAEGPPVQVSYRVAPTGRPLARLLGDFLSPS